MIRFVITVLFLTVFFIISLPLFFIEWVIGKFNRRAKDISSLRIVQFAFKVILFLSGTKTTVIGLEKIPKDEAVLFVGNHRSYFDVVIAYSMMPRLTGFVSKKEVESIPLLRVWMRYLYCVFLDRDNIKEGLKSILLGIEYIKNGISIVIFPEGTRNMENDTMRPFKEGSLKFAEKSGCKIVPIAQNNTEACFDKHMPKLKKAHTIIEFCDPIDIASLEKEEKKFLGAHVQKIIEATYIKNKELV